MNKLEIRANYFKDQKDQNELLKFCQLVLEKISDIAPSDNNVTLSIERQGLDFIAKLNLSSQNLAFDCLQITRSPFMAIEKVSKEAIERIRNWSVRRK